MQAMPTLTREGWTFDTMHFAMRVYCGDGFRYLDGDGESWSRVDGLARFDVTIDDMAQNLARAVVELGNHGYPAFKAGSQGNLGAPGASVNGTAKKQ